MKRLKLVGFVFLMVTFFASIYKNSDKKGVKNVLISLELAFFMASIRHGGSNLLEKNRGQVIQQQQTHQQVILVNYNNNPNFPRGSTPNNFPMSPRPGNSLNSLPNSPLPGAARSIPTAPIPGTCPSPGAKATPSNFPTVPGSSPSFWGSKPLAPKPGAYPGGAGPTGFEKHMQELGAHVAGKGSSPGGDGDGPSNPDAFTADKIKEINSSKTKFDEYMKSLEKLDRQKAKEKKKKAKRPIEVIHRKQESKALEDAAKTVGKDPVIQRDVDHLVEQLSLGNKSPGTSIRKIEGLKNVFEARGRNGGRVYFREINKQTLEILAKSNKANQLKVIKILKRLGY